ncbi:MAG TPA: ribonucleotide-diphosphate reductase subunit beta, partial [Azohydromonas sp.]|nr:ribonucleotide-diphosphate reductase subunit beta [Azohydromonas sp.]
MLVWEDDVRPSTTPANPAAPSRPRDARTMTPSPLSSPSLSLAEAVPARRAPPSMSPVQPASAPSQRRVNVADKRIINGQTDVNQLVPFKYKWAWEKYL